MDSSVSARFFRASPPDQGSRDIPEILLDLMEERPEPGEREQRLGGGVTMRLERCRRDGEVLEGEFCRKQTENVPPTADNSGLAALDLQDGQGLGHMGAFIYHVPTRALLLQTNRLSATPNRIGVYLAAYPNELFSFSPIIREDAWDRFRDRRIRSMTVRFASPENLESLDREGVGVAQGARLLADIYDAPTIEISVRAGRSRTKDLGRRGIERTIRKLLGSAAEVEALSVTTAGDDGDINFLHDHLKAGDTLDLTDLTPQQNYNARMRWMRGVFGDNLAYLQRHFARRRTGENRS